MGSLTQECKAGGLHAPSHASVNEFVRQVRGRIRFFSVCEPDLASEVGAVVTPFQATQSFLTLVQVTAALSSSLDEGSDGKAKRASSCPLEKDLKEMQEDQDRDISSPQLSHRHKGCCWSMLQKHPCCHQGHVFSASLEVIDMVDAQAQTDEFKVFPYEHLFPSVLPQLVNPTAGMKRPQLDLEDNQKNPYDLLDKVIEASVKEGRNDTNDICLLKNLMLYEMHRRSVLGLRNRRLLGKTKSSRILEEQNTALVSKCLVGLDLDHSRPRRRPLLA